MLKLIAFIMIILACFGCSPAFEIRSVYADTYNGHDYLLMRGPGSSRTILHDPDCKCQSKR